MLHSHHAFRIIASGLLVLTPAALAEEVVATPSITTPAGVISPTGIFTSPKLPDASTPSTPESTVSTSPSPPPVSLTPDQQRRLQAWKDQLTMLDAYVSDAIDSNLKLKLDLPLMEIQQKQFDAHTFYKRFNFYALTRQYQPAAEAYRDARNLLNAAKVLAIPSYHVEGRALWLDRGSIIASQTPEGLKSMLRQIHDMGINTVFFETINAGFPLYKSDILPKNPLLTEGWDPLQVAVETGHQLGLEIHAWVWCFAVGNLRHNDIIQKSADYAGPVLEDKGLMSEALRGPTGNLIPKKGRQSEYWLSPASPKARAFLMSLYQEIVSRYNVDGLQLDYIRYPFQNSANQMGYEALGRKRFEEETGLYLNSLDDYTLKSFAAWKTYQVTQFVQEVSETLRRLRPNLKLSAAVYPMKRPDRILAIQQDWETWLDKGWLDLINPMTYTPSPNEYQRTLDNFKITTQKPAIFYPGIALHRLDGDEVIRLEQITRDTGLQGNTLFANAHLSDVTAEKLRTSTYRLKPAVPPHQNPGKCAQLIVADLTQAIDRLGKAGDTGFSESLGLLRQVEQSLSRLQQHASPDTLDQLKTQQGQLLQVASQLQKPSLVHPYRTVWFRTQILQLQGLLGYLAAHTAV